MGGEVSSPIHAATSEPRRIVCRGQFASRQAALGSRWMLGTETNEYFAACIRPWPADRSARDVDVPIRRGSRGAGRPPRGAVAPFSDAVSRWAARLPGVAVPVISTPGCPIYWRLERRCAPSTASSLMVAEIGSITPLSAPQYRGSVSWTGSPAAPENGVLRSIRNSLSASCSRTAMRWGARNSRPPDGPWPFVPPPRFCVTVASGAAAGQPWPRGKPYAPTTPPLRVCLVGAIASRFRCVEC